MKKLIATHNKIFHADEVTAIALLEIFTNYEVDKLIKFIRVNGIEGVEKKLSETQNLMENVDKEYQEKSLTKINLMFKKYNYTKE